MAAIAQDAKAPAQPTTAPGRSPAPATAPVENRTALFDEIWRELSTHDAFFEAKNEETELLGARTREQLRETSDESERIRIIIRTLSRLGDGHLHLTTRWFLPDRPPPPIELTGGEPQFRPRGGFAKFRRDYYMRVPLAELNAESQGANSESASSQPAATNTPVDCRVIEIDGALVSHGGGWALLNGPRDTGVSIKLERPDGSTTTISRKRTEPVVPPQHFAPTTQVVTTRPDGTTRIEEREVPVEFQRLDGNLGYIRIAHLVTTQTINDFNAALDQLMDTDGLILDIRGNTGGYPWIMMPIAGRFFSEYQRVCSFDGRSPSIGALVRGVGKVGIPPAGRAYSRPVVALINDGTASMGEGLAFALGDTGRAKLVGRPTMGLNAAIRNVTLQNGLVLWHSWIRVSRLSGDHYQGIGVQPHELVELDEAMWRKLGIAQAIRAEQELQLQAAKSALRSTMP
ncbi:MAG: hypothetical protein JNG88_14025 [Phycisphaerales bacterium]|nr:hypothetical protein [Phycisphaerales bacterium]